jgi:hypothetical protein
MMTRTKRIKFLSLTVAITVSLLLIGAILVVLGIFNSYLNWDIVGPQLQNILYGIFATSLALGAFGVAITVVLGIQEIVNVVGSLNPNKLDADAELPDAPKLTYIMYMLGMVAGLTVLVGALSFVNQRVLIHRSGVFKRIAAEQMQKVETRFYQQVSLLTAPPKENIPETLHDLIVNVNKLSFVSQMTLYIPDPEDKSVIWSYNTWGTYDPKQGFSRLFVAKEFEEAIQQALQGQPELLNELNQRTGFRWYSVIENEQGKPIGVLRVDGNKRENFRDYSL